MALKVNLDTTAAHKALDELLQKVQAVNAQKNVGSVDSTVDPAKVAQAQKRWNRRNGITDRTTP